MASQN